MIKKSLPKYTKNEGLNSKTCKNLKNSTGKNMVKIWKKIGNPYSIEYGKKCQILNITKLGGIFSRLQLGEKIQILGNLL